jgi:CheY-like chemotaxis protein
MPTWLVLEDEKGFRDVLEDYFTLKGIDVIFLENGTQAFRWIDEVNNAGKAVPMPEVALLDIRMPELDINGIHVGHRLRSSPVLGKLPIVMMSVYKVSEFEMDEMRLITGANAFFDKGGSLAQLFKLAQAEAKRPKGSKASSRKSSAKK